MENQLSVPIKEDHGGGGGESLAQEPCTEEKQSQLLAQPAFA